jgi:phage gp29-like protein
LIPNSLLTNELVTREQVLTFQRFIGILPNPDKVIQQNGGVSKIFPELKNDPHIWSCMQSRKAGVLSQDWDIFDRDANSDVSQFIRKIFQKLDVFNLMNNILESVFTGMQVLEIIWEYDENGNYIPKDIIPKPLEWFYYDEQNILKFRKRDSLKGDFLPESKFLIPRNLPTYSNPYGESLLAKCYWPATIKNVGFRFWMNFLEKYGLPIIIGQYTYSPTPEELQSLSDRLNELVESQTIATPNDINIDIRDIGQSKSVELYAQLIRMANAEISKALLSETLTTELEHGSYAASATHFKVREDVILSDKILVENTLNILCDYITKLNFPKMQSPIFKFRTQRNLSFDIDNDVKLASIDNFQFKKEYFMKKYDLNENEFYINNF